MGRDKEQRDKEGEAWKRFRFELERRWHNLYSGFVEAKHIHSMRRLGKCGFLVVTSPSHYFRNRGTQTAFQA
jgi:hypothetical protein